MTSSKITKICCWYGPEMSDPTRTDPEPTRIRGPEPRIRVGSVRVPENFGSGSGSGSGYPKISGPGPDPDPGFKKISGLTLIGKFYTQKKFLQCILIFLFSSGLPEQKLKKYIKKG